MEKSKDFEEKKDAYVEKLVKLNRVSKVVKGGKRFSFSAARARSVTALERLTMYPMPSERLQARLEAA